MHNRLFELIDLSRLGKVSEERVRQDIALATRRILDEQRVLLTLEERERVVTEIQDEVFGLGPLEPLLADPTVSDVLVNGHDEDLRGAQRPARAHGRALQGRHAPDADHREDRVERRAPRGRAEPDGRRAAGRRLARERDHPAARARRPAALDPPFSGRPAARRGPDRARLGDAADRRGAARRSSRRGSTC